jgi:hypothetical protein
LRQPSRDYLPCTTVTFPPDTSVTAIAFFIDAPGSNACLVMELPRRSLTTATSQIDQLATVIAAMNTSRGP